MSGNRIFGGNATLSGISAVGTSIAVTGGIQKWSIYSNALVSCIKVHSEHILCSKDILFGYIKRLIVCLSDYDPTKPPRLTLSSVHKSKGLEWPTVYLFGRSLWMPSQYATQPWMEDQEQYLS